tara:strand:+ start:950 stop:1309 length:360 start_codon:yes stop_codon:yes gene_type:complete
MSSTTNKNTPGNYQLEQKMNNNLTDRMLYINAASSEAYTNHFAGNGLLMGSNARSHLSDNYCDIESQLRGIGTSNLVNPKASIQPELKYMQSLSISDRLPTIVPEPLKPDIAQRHFPIP